MAESTPAAGVILAAGASSRMGQPKAVLPYGDGTVINTVIRAAEAAGLEPVVVVTGFDADAVLAVVPEGVEVVTNPDPSRGTGSSLGVGLASVDASRDVVVMLADMPDVSQATINDLVTTSRNERSVAGWVRYADGHGHPVFLSRGARARAGQSGDDQPLWSMLASLDSDERTDLVVDSPKPLDLNTPDDYRVATSIGFDQYMRSALYDPEGGFFSAGPVRAGTEGDFVTSPEVSPWFGRLIGRWVRASVPRGTHLVEVGAGTGSLVEPLLAEVGDHLGSASAVELSAAARAAMASRLPGVDIRERLELPDGPVVVVANELLDNMPARLVERTTRGWAEWRVTTTEPRELVMVGASTDVGAWCDTFLEAAPAGRRLAAQMEGIAWLQALASRPETRVLAFDYAASTKQLARRSSDRVVRTFRGHREGDFILDDPGSVDLTLEVNLDAVVTAVEAVCGQVSIMSQSAFLRSLGADEVLLELRERERVHAAAGEVMEQLAARSEAVNLGALLDDAGLGGFSVLDVHSGTQNADPGVQP